MLYILYIIYKYYIYIYIYIYTHVNIAYDTLRYTMNVHAKNEANRFSRWTGY